MLTKIVELPSQFSTGEATVQLVATGGRNGKTLRESTSLQRTTKLASESPALDMIRSIQPMQGRTIMLIIGLGDHETYGPNRRGDSFPSEPIPGRVAPGETLKDWYQTYDTANVFRHHINHDPAGAIGKVIKSFWNPFMHRVEVIQYVDHDRAPDILEKLMSGVPLATSMGCLTAGTQITMADGSRKAVEDIVVGDRVLTHERRPRPVTELHRRPYVGGVVTVRAEALDPLTVTTEHPFYVAKRSALQMPGPSGKFVTGHGWREDAKVEATWVHAECLDPEAHMLLTPIPDGHVYVGTLGHERRIVDGYVVSPIRELTREDAEIDVYNFEVEEDQSYVGGSVVLHNCHVPYDVCTCCGNRAVSRAEYCMHLLHHMGEINPDGTQNAALNPNPKFFDSSLVTRPADRNGFVLRKVADANTGRTYEIWSPSRLGGADLAKIAAELRQKAADHAKLSDIEKTIAGTIEASSSGTPEGTMRLVRQYADHAMPNECTGMNPGGYTVDATSGAEGANANVKVASLGGLLNYAMRLEGVTTTAPMLRASLAHAGDVQAIFAAYPRFHSDVCKLANIRDDITDKYHRAEVAASPYLDVSNVLGSGQTAMRPLTDKLTYTDPHGHTYETTVGLARRARNFDTVANQTRPLQIGLSAVGMGNIFGNAGHSALLHRPSKELMTNEGEKITTNTEMVRTASFDDGSTKGQRKTGAAPIEMAAVDFRAKDGRPAKLASDVRDSLWAAIRGAEVVDDLSDALGPTLDLAKVASALGKSILDSVR